MNDLFSPVDLLNDLSICFTKKRILASQMAVLTTVARYPKCTSSMIKSITGLSHSRVCRSLTYLKNVGDIFVDSSDDLKIYYRKKYIVTDQGVLFLKSIFSYLLWENDTMFKKL